MADLLQQGATLTDLSCPQCASPLFRLQDGSLWCGKDQKRVVVVKEGEEPPRTSSNASIDNLEKTLITKVDDLQLKIQHTNNVEELAKLSSALNELLSSLEKIGRMKKS